MKRPEEKLDLMAAVEYQKDIAKKFIYQVMEEKHKTRERLRAAVAMMKVYEILNTISLDQ